jgi:hypothetical protein
METRDKRRIDGIKDDRLMENGVQGKEDTHHACDAETYLQPKDCGHEDCVDNYSRYHGIHYIQHHNKQQ